MTSYAPASSAYFDLRCYSLATNVESDLHVVMPNQPPWSIHYAMRYAVLPDASKKGTVERAPTVLCVVASKFLGEIPRLV